MGDSSDSIASKLRQLLVDYGLRITFAQGKVDFFEEERKINSALPGSRRKAIRAKMYRDVYKTYCTNMSDKKARLEGSINEVLAVYDETKRKVWFMHFVKQSTVAEIMEATHYTERSVKRIIAKMKVDMREKFEGGYDNDQK